MTIRRTSLALLGSLAFATLSLVAAAPGAHAGCLDFEETIYMTPIRVDVDGDGHPEATVHPPQVYSPNVFDCLP